MTATQSVITAIEAVLQTANQVLELTPVDEMIVGGQIAEDLALLAEIVVSAELVWYDLQSLEAQITALFGLDNAPDTRAGLDERLLEIKQFYYRSLSFAMRTQTLVMTMFRTVEHVSRLIDAVGALIGNMQGNQVARPDQCHDEQNAGRHGSAAGGLAAGRHGGPALPGGHSRQSRQDQPQAPGRPSTPLERTSWRSPRTLIDDITAAFLAALATGGTNLGVYSLAILSLCATIAYYKEYAMVVMHGTGLGDALAGLLVYVMGVMGYYWLMVNLFPDRPGRVGDGDSVGAGRDRRDHPRPSR